MARKQLIKDILVSIVASPILAFGIVIPLVILIGVVQRASGHEPNFDDFMPGLYFFCIPIALGVWFRKTKSWKSMKGKPGDFH